MRTFRRSPFVLSLGMWLALYAPVPTASSQAARRTISVAVIDFADTTPGRVASQKLATQLATSTALTIVDRDLAGAAARGAGYAGSLNLSLSEARDLGAAIGCDFYILGDAQTVRRSPSTGAAYYEAYASIFLVSTRTGRLISWSRPSFEAATFAAAERLLLDQLGKDETVRQYSDALQKAREDERLERELAVERNTLVIEEVADDSSDAKGLRSPRPYRRLRPAYPDTAARAEAAGTVDVLVDLDKEGEVNRVDIARWAGFGLDEAAMDTVRQLHFFPASRDGVSIPIRVLLRYNFRRPTR